MKLKLPVDPVGDGSDWVSEGSIVLWKLEPLAQSGSLEFSLR